MDVVEDDGIVNVEEAERRGCMGALMSRHGIVFGLTALND